ncbi:30S ribosomal protein S8e [ANME-2 cluster archaeon]|nr:MAG: 30S ribosomal protein S8e [ANME-2 cluster archaeon]RLG25422.1 MAG: 30S ribosomal protein S8e [Methanosarcinales archaeon]
MKWQGDSRRRSSGGRIIRSRGKRRFEMGREPADTHLAPVRSKKIRTFGGNQKLRLFRCDVANVTNPEDGTTQKCVIETVEGNPANQYYTRRNIITKGAIIKTNLGSARVTNRPGQEGIVNAVLM